MLKRKQTEEETIVIQQLQKLAQQDDHLPLPESLHSSALLGKLQEQPTLTAYEGGLMKKRTMYVVSTCAAAFLVVIGLTRTFPMMNSANTMAAAPAAASSVAMAAAETDGGSYVLSDYQQVADALRILYDAAQAAPAAEEGAAMLKTTAAAAPIEPTDPNELKACGGGVDADDLPNEDEEFPIEELAIDDHPAEESIPETEEALEEPIEEALEEPEEEVMLTSATPLRDEPYSPHDLVSTSGEWVYWLEQKDTTTLHLFNAETMQEEATLSLPEVSMISELASYSNLLVCIDPNNFTSDDETSGITVYLYQLGEDKTASLLNTIAVSGTYDQSYLTADGTLFLASNQYLPVEDAAAGLDISEVLPKVFNDLYQDQAEPLPFENIAVIENPLQPNYLNVTAIDLANGGAACTWSFLGREGTVTISDHMMQMITPDGEGGTQLINIDFSGNTVSYRISKSIPEN